MPSRLDPARVDGAFLPAWLMTWFEERYAGERTVDELASLPYANPLAANDLSGLPPMVRRLMRALCTASHSAATCHA